LLRRLPGNVLTRQEMETLFFEHSLATGGEEKHVFCALFRVGLLGYVEYDRVRGEWAQRFLRPGEATLEPDGMLPQATHYLLHPVLQDVIGRVNASYQQNVHRGNIVGYGKPWRAQENVGSAFSVHALSVLKGDIYGFGTLMHARIDGPVRQALDEAVRRWAKGAAAVELGAGDSLLIAHEDPVALAQAARHIIDEVYQADGQPRLRVALHFGEVHLQADAGDAPPLIVGGDAILCAARVEPHVLPAQIWATEEFREQLARRPSLWRTTPVIAPDGSDRFNVRKDGRDEPDLWVRLYRLEF